MLSSRRLSLLFCTFFGSVLSSVLAIGCDLPPPCPRVRAVSAPDEASPALSTGPGHTSPKKNLDSARELDRQGVHAYAQGRYSDAAMLFRESFGLGGPASELWNIARSEERQDRPESAASAIEAYLAQPGLSTEDRAGAQRELEVLRARPSSVTVTSTPSGAAVTIDGQAAPPPSVTPISFEVGPGTHTVGVKRDAFRTQTVRIDARYGRAVVIDVALDAPP
jgi:PEGA domain